MEDALRLVAERGRLMQRLPSGGAMAAVFSEEDRVRRAIDRFPAELAIAAVNAPGELVISGAAGALQSVVAELKADGVRSLPLKVSHAFHSPLMDSIVGEFERFADQFSYAAPQLPVVSSVTGTPAPAQTISASYWARQLRAPVRFASGTDAASPGGPALPGDRTSPALSTPARRCIDEAAATALVPAVARSAED